jgi:hypothetical protein
LQAPDLEESTVQLIFKNKDHINTLRTGDADLRLYAYKQFKYPVPNLLRNVERATPGSASKLKRARFSIV